MKLKPFSTRPLVRGAPLATRALILVGEARRGSTATTGEGIAQAILMGGIAAKHLARALRLDDDRLDGYGADVLDAAVGRHLLQSAWLAPSASTAPTARRGAPSSRTVTGWLSTQAPAGTRAGGWSGAPRLDWEDGWAAERSSAHRGFSQPRAKPGDQ